MSDPVTEVRALLMQFEKSDLKDIYVRSRDWTVFMARPGGAANPMQLIAGGLAEPVAQVSITSVTAPHLGLFEPACAAGDVVAAGQLIALIDVLGRKTNVTSAAAGRVSAIHFAANDLVEFGEVLADIAAA
jgi:acetyl-CoA carboxylase biotin carboxyl carrier protein